MADRYLKATGDWNNNATWSATDGGAAGASFPVAGDDVFITANGDGLTLTVNVTSFCAAVLGSGATTATITMNSVLVTTGDLTFLSTMTINGNNTINLAGNSNLTTNGLAVRGGFKKTTVGTTTTLQDNLTTNSAFGQFGLSSGTLDLNGKTIILLGTSRDGGTADVKHMIFNGATLTCAGWDYTGTNLTITPDTGTLIITGTGVFAGLSKTYNNVELNGTAHTISGSNTFATLTLKADTTQTITFTDGTTQTITTPVFTGSSGKVKTLVGTGTGGWTITKAGGGTVDADYLALSYSTATPGQTWYTANSTDTVGNSGWIFAWIGKFSGVTNPAKINGIAVRTIQKVIGVD